MSRPLDLAKLAFIEACIAHGVLLFGSFTLKSGRRVLVHEDVRSRH